MASCLKCGQKLRDCTCPHSTGQEMVPGEYQLTLSEKQMRVLSRACELLARLGMGQLEEAALPEITNQSVKRYRELHDALLGLRTMATGLDSPSAFLGHGHERIPEDCNIAWDLYKVLRHRLAWDRHPEGGITVDFDDPNLLTASNHPLAKAERLGGPCPSES